MNNIASERKKLGLSQEGLAEALGTTRDSVKKYESGETAIRSTMLIKMADYFGCSLDYLMGRTEERLSHIVIQH
jgi:transcriptional regulator with XRE-family HTH domain